MPERFPEIEKTTIHKQSLEERLNAYPELKAKVGTILGIIENAGYDLENVGEVEGPGVDRQL